MYKIKLILLVILGCYLFNSCEKADNCNGSYTVRFKTYVCTGLNKKPLSNINIVMYNANSGLTAGKNFEVNTDKNGEASVTYKCSEVASNDFTFVLGSPFNDIFCWNQDDSVKAGQNITKEFYFSKYCNYVVKFREKKPGSFKALNSYYIKFLQYKTEKIFSISDSLLNKDVKLQFPLIGDGRHYISILKSISLDSLTWKFPRIQYIPLRGEPFVDTIELAL